MAIDEGPEKAGSGMSVEGDTGQDKKTLWRISRAAGLVTAAIAGLGLIGLVTGITAFTSVCRSTKPSRSLRPSSGSSSASSLSSTLHDP